MVAQLPAEQSPEFRSSVENGRPLCHVRESPAVPVSMKLRKDKYKAKKISFKTVTLDLEPRLLIIINDY